MPLTIEILELSISLLKFQTLYLNNSQSVKKNSEKFSRVWMLFEILEKYRLAAPKKRRISTKKPIVLLWPTSPAAHEQVLSSNIELQKQHSP